MTGTKSPNHRLIRPTQLPSIYLRTVEGFDTIARLQLPQRFPPSIAKQNQVIIGANQFTRRQILSLSRSAISFSHPPLPVGISSKDRPNNRTTPRAPNL